MHLSYIHCVIDHGVYTEEIGQELHAIAGQLTTSLGWFCYDADQQTEARVYFSEALNAAMLTGDNPLATRTLSNMSRQCVDLGKPREAVRFARTAKQYATKWGAPPRVSALLAIRIAQGYARAGDELNTSMAIKRAWRSFDQGASDRAPEWTTFLNEAELTCLEGTARADLGQHKRAVRLLDRSATLQNIEHSRNRGMCLAQLARAALSDRDYDRTTDATLESLRLIEGGQSSTRNAGSWASSATSSARTRPARPCGRRSTCSPTTSPDQGVPPYAWPHDARPHPHAPDRPDRPDRSGRHHRTHRRVRQGLRRAAVHR
ncbi:hypothetical protein [Streptomyces sp. bgisy060]|uniref:hypothetical protein n=1 Tax=Streptomyces sp. bgisy060 TaxID=3413775 RepID=UPI003EB85CF5